MGINVQTSRLRVDFIWTFVGNVVYSASQWGILIVLAKLGSPVLVGQYALGLAVATPVTMFTNLQLRSVQTSDIKRSRSLGDYLRFRLIANLVAMLAIVAVCIVMRYPADKASLIVMVALGQAVEAISDVFYGNLQLNGRMDRIATSMVLRGPLSLGGLVVAIYLTRSLLFGVIALTLLRGLILVVYDARRRVQDLVERDALDWRRILRLGSDFRVEAGLLRLTFPLGVVMLLLSMNTNIPRYFLESSWGPRELGIFSAIAFLLSLGNLVVGALGQSAFVPLARAYDAADFPAFFELLRKLVAVAAVLGIGGVLVADLAGGKLLTILYRPEYARRTDALVWLMVAACFSYVSQFLGYAMTAARYFNAQIPLFAAVTVSITIASYFLVPAQGLSGAVFSILIAAIVQLAGCGLVLATAVGKQSYRAAALARTA